MPDVDLALVGGGLQNALIALAVLHRQPNARVILLERDAAIGGNHTWCFHQRDVPAALRGVIDPLVIARWDGYEVRFPTRTRRVALGYAATSSASVARAVEAAFAGSAHGELRTGAEVVAVEPHRVVCGDGRVVDAALVIDARGPATAAVDAGYQKFVGLELELGADHGLARPILIDATVEQRDGFRFFYVLPLARRRVLVEETTFSRDPGLDAERATAACLGYAAAAGLTVAGVARQEHGALPMPWRASPSPPRAPLQAGYGGGWFHPATGYSFPIAARLAAFVAERPASTVLGSELDQLWRRHDQQALFARRLNWLLFHCFAPGDAWNVYDRFYRLPDDVIARFYALETTIADRARILIGRPPRGFSLTAWRHAGVAEGAAR